MSAIIKGVSRQTNVTRPAEGTDVYLRMLRDGSVSVADVVATLGLEGRVFCANHGTITTPVAFGAGDMNGAEFDLHVAVPAGVTILPLEIRVVMEAWGATTGVFEACANYGTGSVIGTDSTAVTPVNMNTNSARTSSCTIKGSATAGTAMTGKLIEFWRVGHIQAITPATAGASAGTLNTTFRWAAKDSGIMPVVGPSAQLGIFASAITGTGFITLIYAELDSSAVV